VTATVVATFVAPPFCVSNRGLRLILQPRELRRDRPPLVRAAREHRERLSRRLQQVDPITKVDCELVAQDVGGRHCARDGCHDYLSLSCMTAVPGAGLLR
jgi:hypothetical protein